MNRPKSYVRLLLAILLLPAALDAQPGNQLSPLQKQLNTESFETVWATVRDKHWETNPGGLDWHAIHAEYRPLIEKADTMDAARSVMRQMLARLHQTHFGIIAAGLAEEAGRDASGIGTAGFEVQDLDGAAIVTSVDPGSPAAMAGVRMGWEVTKAGAEEIRSLIAKLDADSALHELQKERAISARLTGPVGETRDFTFADAKGEAIVRMLTLAAPRGEMAGFGNLAPVPVWFEAKRLGPKQNAEYIRLNWFFNLVRVMDQFGDAVKTCTSCAGIIIDLRGNPGGVGAMAMGMAGWLEAPRGDDQPVLRLGEMQMRGATLNFFINPRAEAFVGPVAILVDGGSASTSEIFAGGLQDLLRARIFGTRTAAAALPSIVTRLPNGDGFQYAVANYISAGGKALEGNGVTPDVEVKLTRKALLAGHDSVLDAALDWVEAQEGKRNKK